MKPRLFLQFWKSWTKDLEKILSMELYPSTEEFLNCKTAKEFSALTGEKRSNKMALPSLFVASLIYLWWSSRSQR
jgi:hypothetical protein